MRVFISSVTYALKEERENLARLLPLVDHEPLRFEDFTSVDRSSRDACLAGVDECDVYVLLLGPRYGDALPDSGLAPTAEELKQARFRNKPILVFTKDTDEPDEPAQASFKSEVEHYISGRFRKSFRDSQSLNLAVLEALKNVELVPAPLRWESLHEAVTIEWREAVPELADRRHPGPPVVEVHLIPVANRPILASRMQSWGSDLARTGREAGFFSQEDHLQVGSNSRAAWAWVPDGTAGGGSFLQERQVHQYRGVAVLRSGQLMAFESLPTDFIGALVNHEELQQRGAHLLDVSSRLLPVEGGTGTVAIAAALGPLDRVLEGDPSKVNGRSSGSLGLQRGGSAMMVPDRAVPGAAIAAHTGDIAGEIAAILMEGVREGR